MCCIFDITYALEVFMPAVCRERQKNTILHPTWNFEIILEPKLELY